RWGWGRRRSGCPRGLVVRSSPRGLQMLLLARASRDERLTEMIPRATNADLDDVAPGAAMVGGHRECLVQLPYTSVIRLEIVGVNVGEELQLIFVTDRTWSGAPLAHVAGGPQQLGV